MSEAIKPAIRELADMFKGGMSVEKGAVTLKPETAVAVFEKAGVDTSALKDLQNAQANIAAAQGLALGEVSIAAMQKDKALDRTECSLAFGKDTIGSVFSRSVIGNAAPGSAEKVERFGVLRTAIQVNAAGNKGDLKKVRSHLTEEATKLLSK